jgi:hypothetical protein
MLNTIIILNQVADTITLYANCFKNGYTKLHYFYDPEDITIIDLTDPKITVKDLQEKKYYFYCTNSNGEEAGHINTSISMIRYQDLWNNILAYADQKKDSNTDKIFKMQELNYVLALYQLMYDDLSDIEIDEELLMAATAFYNIRQESLNSPGNPEITIKENKFYSINSKKYKFIPYAFDLKTKKWNIIKQITDEDVNSYTFYGKPSVMYRICVLSDFSLVREYLYYQPSETMSETILEGHISARQELTEKTAEIITQIDVSDILDDEYGQQVVCALQNVTPDYPVVMMPQIEFDNVSSLFHVNFAEPSLLQVTDYSIYLAALEIDQAFYNKKVPHRILVTGDSFIFNPRLFNMNYEEDYIFYICNEDGVILSNPVLCGYGTQTDTELYFTVSRKNDVEQYRRRLLNVFKKYNKSEWNTVSTILDKYSADIENLYIPITDYLIEDITRLDAYQHRIEYLIQLVLLNQLQYYLPVDQTFIKEQVYAEGYHKHVFPERQETYLIRRGRINKNTIDWDYITCSDEVREIRVDRNKILIMQAANKEITRVSPYVLYHNIYAGDTRYFYYPSLEVTVAHGL